MFMSIVSLMHAVKTAQKEGVFGPDFKAKKDVFSGASFPEANFPKNTSQKRGFIGNVKKDAFLFS